MYNVSNYKSSIIVQYSYPQFLATANCPCAGLLSTLIFSIRAYGHCSYSYTQEVKRLEGGVEEVHIGEWF